MSRNQKLIRLLKQLNAPTLLPDTCSILDVIRDSHREKGRNVEQTMAAMAILDAARSTPPKCAIVRASLIKSEYNQHIDHTVEEMEREITSLQEKMQGLDKIASLLGITGYNSVLDRSLTGILQNQAQEMIDLSNEIDRTDEVQKKAGERVIQCIAPARRGNDAFKDCLIFEEYLALITELRNASFAQPIVFITSNRKDYCDSSTNQCFHASILQDSQPLKLALSLHWHHAKHLLGL